MPVSSTLINLETRRQIMLERVKNGVDRDLMRPMLLKMAKDLRERLLRSDLTDFSRKRQTALLKDISGIMSTHFDANNDKLIEELTSVAINESKFEAKALNTISTGSFEATLPAPNQIIAAITSAPLSLRTSDSGKILKPWIKDWGKSQVKQVEGIIKTGFFEGATTQQMVSSVTGAISNDFQGGDFQRIKRSATALVRTATQHVAMVARRKTLEDNGVEKYLWVATLDSRTSEICQGLSGRTFTFGEGPMPPVHPNERSTITAVLPKGFQFLEEDAKQSSIDGPVDAKLTYYDWLKTQPKGFQDDVLGPSWTKVFRDGGIDAKEFAKLRLNKRFLPITLDELEAKAPLVFESAGLTS